MVGRLLRALKSAVRLMVSGDARLREAGDQLRRLQKEHDAAAERARELQKGARVQGRRIESLQASLNELVKEVRALRQQTSLQLHRLQRNESPSSVKAVSLAGSDIPLTVDAVPVPWRRPVDGVPHPDPEGREWLELTACPYCAHETRTEILEWNKLIILEVAPDETSARYAYSLCHACGVLYAARRPAGARFRYLLEHFGEVTAKGGDGTIKNPLLNPYALTEADEAHLRRTAANGVFVSDHLGLTKREYLEGLVKDRFENSAHVDVLGSLLPLSGARVLELRPRTGAIAESLRRLYRADVSVVPMWESQQLLLKEVYGLESRGLVDYDHFTSPYEGPFDLVVGNHMLTHMIRPAEFLREVYGRLKPGGHVYFYNEPQDLEYLARGQSMIAHFNPLHMQGFDQASLVRMLAANRFEVVFVKGRDFNHLCLAKKVDSAAMSPMTDGDRQARTDRLIGARDRAILKVPAAMRGRLAGVWEGALRRAVESGDVEFDPKGRARFVSPDRRRR